MNRCYVSDLRYRAVQDRNFSKTKTGPQNNYSTSRPNIHNSKTPYPDKPALSIQGQTLIESKVLDYFGIFSNNLRESKK